MAIESEHFVFTEVQRKHLESNEVGRYAKPAQKGAPLSLTSYCKSCEHLWVANRNGEGNFKVAVGGVNVVCPSCNAHEFVSEQLLEKA